MKMFERFENSEYYEAIKIKLDSIVNPQTFYNTIQNLSYGELLGDIAFMYEANTSINYLQIMAEELGIETEEYEIEGE